MGTAPEYDIHQEWIGYVQPEGLLVSPPALVKAQAVPSPEVRELQAALNERVDIRPRRGGPDAVTLPELKRFLEDLCHWPPETLIAVEGDPSATAELEVHLREYEGNLLPTHGVRHPDDDSRWLMAVLELPAGESFDKVTAPTRRAWHASAQERLERILHERTIPLGIGFNQHTLRLTYAPERATAGHADFHLRDMVSTAGRPILAALHMLLDAERVFYLPADMRLEAICQASREHQNTVSETLADQVLGALNALLRGFQSAHEQSGGRLLQEVIAREPEHLYGGLLTTLLRLIFLLYAEDRRLMSDHPLYREHYSVTRLFEQLRKEAALYPDMMDQRYGAWPQLLTLFRLVFDGMGHGALQLPARGGMLFNPDRHPFLEGRPLGVHRNTTEKESPPRVSDGVILEVLSALMVLDGERLSYRDLDVEHIGAVYEHMMGFQVEVARGASVAVTPHHVVVDLETLLAEKPSRRSAVLKAEADCTLSGTALSALKKAESVEALLDALGRRRSRTTPLPLAADAFYLQPGQERRRSGSHYTRRELTEPIVEKALEPLLARLGARPHPSALRALRVCDPAMGSGAFLVEACRQLGATLKEAWENHGVEEGLDPREDLQTLARNVIAQECLYGVDRNPFAVDLAKLSLWLFTLARTHPFTFLDHALCHGDSLVGLDRRQVESLHWKAKVQVDLVTDLADSAISEALEAREQLHSLSMSHDNHRKRQLLKQAEQALEDLRLIADLPVAAFFAESKAKEREKRRQALEDSARVWLEARARGSRLGEEAEEARLEVENTLSAGLQRLLEARAELKESPTVSPFHWPLEFPEVFSRENPGFDAFVGNPPFMGGSSISSNLGGGYRDYLLTTVEHAHGNSDVVAFFFRRAFSMLRRGGTFGLIATNTIAQGDTRSTGLHWICTHGATLYHAERRKKWPGIAAVVVSVVHGIRGVLPPPFFLDGRYVEVLTAFLFHTGGHDSPIRLTANAGKSFLGSKIYGQGFLFAADDSRSTPLSEMEHLAAKDPRNAERIFPYLGGQEVNSSPTHAHHRYVINFEQMSEEEARQWPDLIAIVEEKVRPARLLQKREIRKKYWWRFGEVAPALYRAIRPLKRVLVNSQVSSRVVFAFQPTDRVFAHTLNVYAFEQSAAFALLQSRVHEVWARFLGSSMKDDLRYTPSDCFETFPFPRDWQQNQALEEIGERYYTYRAALMKEKGEGLTATYNRFHDPEEDDPAILELRALHDELDQAVLDAYGRVDLPLKGSSLPPACDFLLDYEEEEEKGRPSRRRKPWCHRWSDDFRDAVLGDLLELNRTRAEEERALHERKNQARAQKALASKLPSPKNSPTQRPRPDATTQVPLFPRKKES